MRSMTAKKALVRFTVVSPLALGLLLTPSAALADDGEEAVRSAPSVTSDSGSERSGPSDEDKDDDEDRSGPSNDDEDERAGTGTPQKSRPDDDNDRDRDKDKDRSGNESGRTPGASGEADKPNAASKKDPGSNRGVNEKPRGGQGGREDTRRPRAAQDRGDDGTARTPNPARGPNANETPGRGGGPSASGNPPTSGSTPNGRDGSATGNGGRQPGQRESGSAGSDASGAPAAPAMPAPAGAEDPGAPQGGAAEPASPDTTGDAAGNATTPESPGSTSEDEALAAPGAGGPPTGGSDPAAVSGGAAGDGQSAGRETTGRAAGTPAREHEGLSAQDILAVARSSSLSFGLGRSVLDTAAESIKGRVASALTSVGDGAVPGATLVASACAALALSLLLRRRLKEK
ncbi:MAG: hypothetical protein M3P96_10580 [Actinomycetota bacterium]|nr:hypothetical protein [Actinomycetota bacterium]